MFRPLFILTLTLGLGLTSASHEKDDALQRHFGGMFGFGGNRPGQLGLQIFCERVQEWLASPAAEVAVTNGTVPSLQELLVDYLTSLCSNTRSGVPLAVDPKPEERHHGGPGGIGIANYGFGFGGNNPFRPNRNPLREFCRRTDTWLQTIEGINITQTETPSTSQEFVLNFLSTVCTGVTGSTRSGAEEEVNIEEFLVQLKRWFNRPKPQSPFNLFCDRANQWLGTSGANITGISGNGDNLPTVFIDFLTNICDNTRKLPEQEENENADKSERWFFRPPFSFSNSCFGQFCEETNNWLETTTLNITASSTGTDLSPTDIFVNLLESICAE